MAGKPSREGVLFVVFLFVCFGTGQTRIHGKEKTQEDVRGSKSNSKKLKGEPVEHVGQSALEEKSGERSAIERHFWKRGNTERFLSLVSQRRS